MSRKKPSGTEPFLKSYGLGYQTGHAEYSPYARVNRLRKTFLGRTFQIDIQRAKLVTEVYQAHPELSAALKAAYALKNVLEHVKLDIYEDELIIGEIAAPAKAAPIYPEFSVDWIIEELKYHPFDQRKHDRFYITEEDKKELLEILPFWQGRTVADYVESHATKDQKKGSEMGTKVFMTNLYHYGGVGHYVMDYPTLLKKGFSGLLKEAEEGKTQAKLQKLKEKEEFYEAVIVELTAAITFVLRYASLARERAEAEERQERKRELLEIEKNCEQIAIGPAQNTWQALQLWHFATSIAHIESNGHSVSYGRMDQWLYPYYEKDLTTGRFTKAFIQELLECAYIKTGNPSKLKDRMTVQVRNGRGWGGESLTIGGVDENGNDATNDLTYMMLEASVHTRMMNPWVCVRIHEKTPYERKCKAVECIRAGYGHPKLYHDEPAIRAMQKKGMSLQEARNYDIVGCVEPDLPGKE